MPGGPIGAGAVTRHSGNIGADNILKQAVWWIDAGHPSAGTQRITNLGWGGQALDAQTGSVNTADSNDPKPLPHTGQNYVYLPGRTGNSLTVTGGSLAATGNVWTITARLNWTGSGGTASTQYLCSRRSFPNEFTIAIDYFGTPWFQWQDGAATQRSLASLTQLMSLPRGLYWYKFTLDASGVDTVATVQFARDAATEPSSGWTTTHTKTMAGVTGLTVPANGFRIGDTLSTGYAPELSVFRFIERFNGVTTVDVDTALCSSGSALSFPAISAHTVDVLRSAAGRKSAAVCGPVLLFGTDDYLEVADSDLIDFGVADSFTTVVVLRQWATPTNYGRYLSKRAVTGAGWQVLSNGTASSVLVELGDAVITKAPAATAISAGAVSCIGAIVDRSAQTARAFTGSTIGAAIDISTLAAESNALPMRVGTYSTGLSAQDFELMAAAVFRRVLSANELTAIANHFTGRYI